MQINILFLVVVFVLFCQTIAENITIDEEIKLLEKKIDQLNKEHEEVERFFEHMFAAFGQIKKKTPIQSNVNETIQSIVNETSIYTVCSFGKSSALLFFYLSFFFH